ncbi:MAG: matrixin family metalloprotease [Candidatus Anammoxibacter sp.]
MIKYTCKLILVLFVTALLWEGDLLAFKLLAGNWSHQGNPMESNWIICTDGMPADAPARIKNGASVWNYSKFTFSFGTDSCDSGGIYPLVNDLNQIDFGGDLGEGVLAENTNWFFTNAPGNTTECDMRFSNSFNWNTSSSDPSSDQQDWQSVAAHEMGHCLGLDHEDGLPTIDPVMTSGIAPGKTKRNPTLQPMILPDAMLFTAPLVRAALLLQQVVQPQRQFKVQPQQVQQLLLCHRFQEKQNLKSVLILTLLSSHSKEIGK